MYKMVLRCVCVLFLVSHVIEALPVDSKESTGKGIIAIASTDPKADKIITFNLSPRSGYDVNKSPNGNFQYNFGAPENIESGRSLSSNINPFSLPLFFKPINFEGLGISGFDVRNLLRGFEGYLDPTLIGDGEVKTVTAVNDNGHVYGEVKTVKLGNKAKKQ